MTNPTERDLDDLVRREVLCCMSSLVSTLAQGYDLFGSIKRYDATDLVDLAALCEQAFELSCSVDDYEEAALQAGFKVVPSAGGGFAWVPNDYQDLPGFDVDSFDTAEKAWRDCCDENSIEPYQRDIFEHWAVSHWLAGKLAAKGERVDCDFAGLRIWGRTTTGQAISMDGVIESIWRDLHAPDVES